MNDSPLSPKKAPDMDSFAGTILAEETLVEDQRSSLRPSQLVEQKLIGMLKASPVMVSQVQRRLTHRPR